MTYHAGIGPRLALAMGTTETGPRMICDVCGTTASGTTQRGDCAAWLRNGKSPPGWRSYVIASGEKVDFCKPCNAKVAAEQSKLAQGKSI